MNKKTVVIGLDCAPPSIVFDPTLKLPNLQRLMQRGQYGGLQSVTPCITVPAWACMMSGKDPGELGVYGFRNRADYSYTNLALATSKSIKTPMLWDTLAQQGKQTILLGVPPSYPVKPIHGNSVACFLTPTPNSPYTHPASLQAELQNKFGGYRMDATGFRTDDKAALLQQIYDMTDQHVRMFIHLLTTKAWDFAMWVEIGTDRIHHGFWRWHDAQHRKHEPNHPFNNAIRAYYEWLDERLGEVLAVLPNDCTILVVSDHGAKRMDGGICINEWLIENGWLVLNEPMPTQPTPFAKLNINWAKTRAWGDGGYYGRIFLNVEGREPQGCIPATQRLAVRAELAEKIGAIPDERGNALPTQCFFPEKIYRQVNGVAPDIMVYFGDLLWRSIGSVGHGAVHTFENDSGPDDCNHAQEGIVITSSSGIPRPNQLIQISDFILRSFE